MVGTDVKDVDIVFLTLTCRWINRLRISKRDWLYLIKLFELEVFSRRTAKEIQLSYPTVLNGYNIIRESILANDKDYVPLKGEIEIDETYFGGRRKGKRGRGASNKVPVFGIIERGGKVKVEVVKDVSAKELLKSTVKVKTVKSKKRRRLSRSLLKFSERPPS